eukprot:COSAG01_NODE_211_length_21847_cov_17.992781_2_plen_53_part_00
MHDARTDIDASEVSALLFHPIRCLYICCEQIMLENLCRTDHGEHFLLLDRVR